jgi:uncharacterized protein YgiM (DUF1202 family)
MTLAEKYSTVIDAAKAGGSTDLQVFEQGGVLHIEGSVPSGDVKDQLWVLYDKVDPNYVTGDLVLNVNTSVVEGGKVKVVTESSNLNIRKGPGTDQPIVGKAAHGEIITLISKANDQWWLVRTNDGEEGYSYAQYLEPVAL